MKTAIIVSGIMREMDLAMPSWKFNGDFFLITQKTYQDARRYKEQHNIINELGPLSEKFKAICIVDRFDTNEQYNSTLHNQTWKWKMAYHFLIPYIEKEKYDRFIFIRPDSYLHIVRSLDELVVEPNTYYTTSDILIDALGLKFINDTWMMFDQAVFEKLSKFYDYVVSTTRNSNIHSLLADFLIESNITVAGDLFNFGMTYQLRKEVRYMFEGTTLRDKYSYYDVAEEITKWNDNNGKSEYRHA
jgi:hypothetical protein